MIYEGAALRVCQETIYRYTYSKEGMDKELWWFCDPSSPWQKGTVENTNRRVRRWLPRKRDITALTDHDMKMISECLNNTLRKCLGWQTPAEVFREKIGDVPAG